MEPILPDPSRAGRRRKGHDRQGAISHLPLSEKIRVQRRGRNRVVRRGRKDAKESGDGFLLFPSPLTEKEDVRR